MRTRCILLVANDDRLRVLVRRILRRERFAIVEFAEPQAALEALPSFSSELSAIVANAELAGLLRARFPHLPILMTPNGNSFELRPLIYGLRALTTAIRHLVPAALPSMSQTMKPLALALAAAVLLTAAAAISYPEATQLETISETTANASIGDINGDGFPDIVLAKGRHWPLADVVLLGDGKGHFKPGPALPNKPDRSYSAPLADLDGDGSLDLVISNDRPDPKIILLNDGKGNFRSGGTFGDPGWPTRNSAVGDLNGDGSPDIALANRPGPAQICFNDGKAHFTCKPLGPETSSTILIGDMNGDGKNDVVVPCRDSCQSVIYFSDGKGNFPRKLPFGPKESSTRAMSLADFNGDGFPDIAACHEDEGLYIYFNDGKGNFGPGTMIAGKDALPYSMTAGDLNKDGKTDIVVGFVNAPGAIYFNDGSGKKYTRVTFGDDKGATYGLAIGDLNGDGLPDIVAARSDSPSLIFFGKPGPR